MNDFIGPRVVLLVFGFLFVSGEALAETNKGRKYITPMYTHLFLDEERGISDDSEGASLVYGHGLGGRIWWETEADFFTLDTGVSGGSDYYQSALTTGLVYAFGDRKRFTPFLIAMVGATYNDVIPDDSDGLDFYANAGVGFVTPLPFVDFNLRADVRYSYDNIGSVAAGNGDIKDGGFEDVRASVGIEIPFGGPSAKPIIVVEENNSEPDDSYYVDSDADGVVDHYDKCPSTISGAKVDGSGCLIHNQIISFSNIFFETNSSRILKDSYPTLNVIADSLSNEHDIKAEVRGHTDSTGSANYNIRLSEERAESVRKYLIYKGVDPERLTSFGFGESVPVASNKTESGRAMNRRVEFQITSH
ncbi:OmpA family protein [Alcanivorax sp.]|uniref:OmpA family protein n=1 Tax=Alcanivorax sp. TaxID=1872427 RepID=UPI000C572A27|nr:OmpA family protein [Alcanivorax sp.]MBQ24623.1 cell envelope biogenesis protein OmpA [Alcanivorax sp.]|tara:strand:+ start:2222 stop:3304 length:1083 start_codon:yes stop_codon:yes gene_type:complete